MRHITFTGFYAGLPVCGVNRADATQAGDTFAHPGRWLDNPALQAEICPKCKKAWDETGDDPEDHQLSDGAIQMALFS